jgi:hypothetical protein
VRALRLLPLAALLMAGCMPYHRAAPGADGWKKGVSRVGVLSAVRVVTILPGHVEELHEEFTDQAAKNVVSALSAGLAARHLTPRVMSWKGDEELDDVRLLYAEVAEAIWRYTYSPWPFPSKRERFEYSVGPIGRILDRAGADLLIVAAGSDQFDQDGNKLSIFSGYGAMALLTLGLVDRQGNVVWFDVWGGSGVDLRKADDVKASIEKMLGELPGVVAGAPVAGGAAPKAEAAPAPAPAPAPPPQKAVKK